MSILRNPAIAIRVVIVAGLAVALAWIVAAGVLTERGSFRDAYMEGILHADGGFRFELGVSYPVLLGIVVVAALLAALNSLFKARRRLRNAP
ncbi:hypothetical protein ACIPY2_09025 [Paenarthrobacter sp. NPDC089675]|uniref:hypothetical protein n=1 Tax=Paenarthrobacter sp. NPDC089675 TaxID=3364376 RepID=UPI00380B4E64